MAEQPIKGSEIVESGVFSDLLKEINAVEQSELKLIATNKTLLESYKAIANTGLGNDSATLKAQQQNVQNVNKSIIQLTNSEIILNEVAKSKIQLQLEEVKLTKALEAEERKRQKALGILNNEYLKSIADLKVVKLEMKGLEVAGKANTQAYKDLTNTFNALDGKIRKAEKSVGEFQRNVGNYKSVVGELKGGLTTLGTQLAATFSVRAIGQFARQILDTRAEFQKFEAVLTNTLGSKSAAQGVLQRIQDLAAKTPFSVSELTASFVKLANQGFKPTNEELVKLGDLAASQGKDFDQLTEAVLDAQNGQFKRLLEFGIRAEKANGKVTLSFKGQKVVVDDNNKSIRDAVIALGDLEGVSGGMAAIAGTLGGQISNLGDNFDSFFNILGQRTEGVMGATISGLNNILTAANAAAQELLKIESALKGTGREFSLVETLINDDGLLLPSQMILSNIEKTASAAKSIAQLAPAYRQYGFELQAVNKRYDEGQISLLQYRRELDLINASIARTKALENDLTTENKTGSEKSKVKQKFAKQELLTQKDLSDEIEQLRINNIKDDEERELQQAEFDKNRAAKKLDDEKKLANEKLKILKANRSASIAAENANTEDPAQRQENIAKINEDFKREESQLLASVATDEQVKELKTKQEEVYQIKVTEIKDKYEKIAIDKNVEFNKTTQAANEEARKEGAEFEISQLEKTTSKKEETISIFNLKEINQLEQTIAAKKIIEIQAEADRKKLLTDNEAERLAIQKKADDDKIKAQEEGQEKISANNKKVLNQALEFEKQIIDAISEAEQEKSDLKLAAFDKQISDQDKNIETQRRLAEKGAANTLAEEEAQKVKLERQKEEEKLAEIKRQKALAFFKLFASYAEKDPDTALTKALRDTVLAEAVSAAFIDGTENVGQDKQFAKNKYKNGQDGYIARFDGDERILSPEQNKKVGDYSNEALADLAYQSRMGLLDTVRFAAIPTDNFAAKVENSALLQQNAMLIKEMQGVREAINNRPVNSWDINKYNELVKTEIKNGFIKNTTYRNRRPRVGD